MFVESNLGMEVIVESTRTDLQIVPLVPDALGNYDLEAARAEVWPRGADYALHLGCVTLKLKGNKQPTKIQGIRLWRAGDTLSSMLHAVRILPLALVVG